MDENSKKQEHFDKTTLQGALSSANPMTETALRSVAVLGIRGVLSLVDFTKSALQFAREEVEDILAEAEFERLKKQVDQEIKESFETSSAPEK